MTTIRIDNVTDYEHIEPDGRAVVENRHSFGKIHVWRNTGRGELYAGFLLWSTDHIAHATPPLDPVETGIAVRGLAASPWCPDYLTPAEPKKETPTLDPEQIAEIARKAREIAHSPDATDDVKTLAHLVSVLAVELVTRAVPE